MGRKDDDDESIWDELMKPASMDYNGDGKIDDLDLYIEMDHLDEALGRGKYDPYEEPYYIAQKEAEEAEEEYEFDGNLDSLAEHIRDGNVTDVDIDANEIVEKYKCGEIDDSTFSTLAEAGYVSYDDIENAGSDEYDDVEDSEDYDNDDVDDSETYAPNGRNTSEKTITLEFSFHNKSEDERKKFPTKGIWRYYDGDEWKFTQALYTYDKKLKEDCGTKYDGDDQVEYLLHDIYQFDRRRAIADWDWLLKTFSAHLLNSTKSYSYDETHSFRLSVRAFFLVCHGEDCSELAEFISRDYVFEYFTVQARWPKHEHLYLENLLLCYSSCDNDDLFIKCYETVLKTQKDCFSKKDLAEVWDGVLIYLDWEKSSERLKCYIKSEIAKGEGLASFTISEEAAETPDTDEPVVEDPAEEEPDTDEPTADEPSEDEPDVDEPTVDEPSEDEPNTDEPATGDNTDDGQDSDITDNPDDTQDADGADDSGNVDSTEEKSNTSLIVMLVVFLVVLAGGITALVLFTKKGKKNKEENNN